MMKNALALLLFLALAAPAEAVRRDAVKVINNSRWEIHHLFMSPSDEQSWGEDLIEDEILATGDSLIVTGIDCDVFDVKVVDEDGDECILEEVDLCGQTMVWKITDKALLECEGDGG